MNLNVIPRTIMKHRRGLLAIGSFVASSLSFAKIWRSRHKIDEILDDTRERRKSEDKKVRREAQWETVKRLTPIVILPAFGMVGSIAMATAAHNVASAEIATYHAAADAAVRYNVTEHSNHQDGTTIDIQEENRKAYELAAKMNTPMEKYFFRPTGEILYFPKGWRHKEMLLINDDIETKSGIEGCITLGEIRALLGKTGGTFMDNSLKWYRQAVYDSPPVLEVWLPNDVYDDEVMWEMTVAGTPSIDPDVPIDY